MTNVSDHPSTDNRNLDVVRWRMRTYPLAVIAGLAAAVLIAVVVGNGASTLSGRLGGDYAAFYGAGRIAVDNDWEHLYEASRQIEAQEDLHAGEPPGEYLYFAYPPFVAAAYAPLASLPFRVSYLAHTFLMALAVAASISLAGREIPFLRRNRTLWLALALTFYPLLRAVIGGQNSALSLFLLVATWRLAVDERDLSAGLVLALLLFKPQYAVPMILLYLIAGRWKVVLGSLAGSVALYAAGAYLMGYGWLAQWWQQARVFSSADSTVNGANDISFVGFVSNLSDSTFLVTLFGFLPALVAIAILALSWMRAHPEAMTEKTAVAATGLILISPHTMYYDASLALITLAFLGSYGSLTAKHLALVWLAALSQALSGTLGWSPIFFLILGIAAWALRSIDGGILDRSARKQALVSAGRPVGTRTRPSAAPSNAADAQLKGTSLTSRPLQQIAADAPRSVALSIIIPAFNEERRIGSTLDSIETYLSGRSESTEVIIVDDGSTDATSEVARASTCPNSRVIRLDRNRGKGYAVRTGMLAATGERRLFMDADGSTHIAEIDKLQGELDGIGGLGIAFGSIAMPDARVVHTQPGIRQMAGRFGNRLIQSIALPGVEDSQRGFKLFSADAAIAIFSRSVVDRWGFDVEALSVANLLGFQMIEVPVEWSHMDESRVTPLSYLTTLIEVLGVKWRTMTGAYDLPGSDPGPSTGSD